MHKLALAARLRAAWRRRTRRAGAPVTKSEGPPRLILRQPVFADQAAFLRLARLSRSLHRPWVAPPQTGDVFRAYVRRARSEGHACFLLCLEPSGDLAGVINLNEIVRGAFHSAYLGYYAFAPTAGSGHMRRGIALALEHAFRELGLHRLEANIQPANGRSIRLVESLGFRREGFSPRYLKVGGRWRDHERWALLAEEWQQHRRSSRAA